METTKPEEIVTDKYIKIPNWFFDSILPHTPKPFSVVLAFIFRDTVGWHRKQFTFTLKEMAAKYGVSKRDISHWLYIMQCCGWIFYRPAKNSAKESSVEWILFPNDNQAREVALAIEKVYAIRKPKDGLYQFQMALAQALGYKNVIEIGDKYQPEVFASLPEAERKYWTLPVPNETSKPVAGAF